MNNKLEIIDHYKNIFNDFKNHSLLKNNSAIESLSAIGFPTLKDEEWRFTNVSPILKEKFSPFGENAVESSEIEDHLLSGFEFDKLVFVDGKFNPELSDEFTLPEGAVIGSLNKNFNDFEEVIHKHFSESNEFKTGFDALNTAFTQDGVFVYIPVNTIIEKPVQIIYYSSKEEKLNTPRNIIIAEKGSSVKIVMNYCGRNNLKYFTNSVNQFFVDENANVDVYKFQDESPEAFHIDKTDIVQTTNSIFSHYSFAFGSSLNRNDINSKLDGENVTCNLYGLYLGNGKRHIDHHTYVDHAKPNSFSNELYKGIMDDQSNGVFSGKILVRQDAQKTNAYQSNKNVLLTKEASVDTKPQLEIYADDVKCSHGATVGRLNEEAYFYIVSRGVPSELAKSMLIRAFASDVIEKVKIEGLKNTLNHLLFEHLHRVEI